MQKKKKYINWYKRIIYEITPTSRLLSFLPVQRVLWKPYHSKLGNATSSISDWCSMTGRRLISFRFPIWHWNGFSLFWIKFEHLLLLFKKILFCFISVIVVRSFSLFQLSDIFYIFLYFLIKMATEIFLSVRSTMAIRTGGHLMKMLFSNTTLLTGCEYF